MIKGDTTVLLIEIITEVICVKYKGRYNNLQETGSRVLKCLLSLLNL